MDGFTVNQYEIGAQLPQLNAPIKQNLPDKTDIQQNFSDNLRQANEEISTDSYQQIDDTEYQETTNDNYDDTTLYNSPTNHFTQYNIKTQPQDTPNTTADEIGYTKTNYSNLNKNNSWDKKHNNQDNTQPTEIEPLNQTFKNNIQPPTDNETGSNIENPKNPTLAQQIRMYKDDQLLANPGGDYFFEKDGKVYYNPNFDQSKFTNRVGKDIKDAMANFKNAAENITGGAKFSYVDNEGKIQSTQKTGLLKTIGSFVQNLFNAITGGKFTEKPPQGIAQTAAYAGKKIVMDGIVKDVLIGIPKSMLNTSESMLLGTLNAMEVIPDATIGNTKAGQKLTTAVFDNGQVALNYITDIAPTGNAWLRVHSSGSKDSGFKLPILYNITTPQQGLEDMRWATVRNTPFRKVIETIGSIVSDAITTGLPFISAEHK